MKYKGIDIMAICRTNRLFEIKQTKPSRIILGKEYPFVDGYAKPEKNITTYVAIVNGKQLESYVIRDLEKKINRELAGQD